MTRDDDPQGDVVEPVRIDTSKPSVMRVYNAMLGGKDNYDVDRKVRDRILELSPDLTQLAWDSRDFLIRVTRYLAEQVGISQFLDCGAALPTVENTHEAAQRANPEARVVYIASDPVVLAHGRALLAENDYTHFTEVEFWQPEQVFQDPTVVKYLDLDQPLAVYHVGTLQYLDDAARPREVMAGYIDALPSGSYVAVAHLFDPGKDHELGGLARRLEELLAGGGVGGWIRTREEILGFLDGLELVEPGLVTMADWWPDGPRDKPLEPVRRLALGGLGRKP